jgi:hypothetical protein
MTTDLLKSLFDEFKYRHELFWKLLGWISVAVLTLDTFPFLKDGGQYNLPKLAPMLFIFPLVGAIITLFGGTLLTLEYRLLARVETAYNEKKRNVDPRTTNSRELDHRIIGYSVIAIWTLALFGLSTVEAVVLYRGATP